MVVGRALFLVLAALSFATCARAVDPPWVVGAQSQSDPSAYPFRHWTIPADFDPSAVPVGVPRVAVAYDSKVVEVDASIVVQGDAARVLQASLAYDQYVKLGMPNVNRCRVMASDTEKSLIYPWCHMTFVGQQSRQYLEVHYSKAVGGIEWRQIARRAEWDEADESAFSVFGGSLYIQQVSTQRVYIRYYLAGKLTTGWPDWLISGMVRANIDTGVRGILSVLAREAQIRQ